MTQMPATIDTTVTFLEMHNRPNNHVPAPINLKLLLLRAENMPVHFYRYLYDTVGRGHYWIDRKKMADADLENAIKQQNISIYVLYVAGVPAGYFELAQADETVDLAYFGLIADYHGHGLGKWLLNEAIMTAWDMNPKRVAVETCTLDAPHALSLYQKLGFVPFARKDKTMQLPAGFSPEM